MAEGTHGVDGNEPAGALSMAASVAQEGGAIAVLLCQGVQSRGNGLDLEGLCRWLRETHAGVQVRVAPDLCHAPQELSRWADAGARRFVLGICSHDYGEMEMQSQARKMGLDPLGIETVNLGAFCTLVPDVAQGTEKAKLLLAAAVAKLRAYPGCGLENLRAYVPPLSQKVSRRGLFTLPPLQYRVVASIDDQRCAAGAGCALCVQACPQGALGRVEETIQMEKTRCDGCGLCVAVCPQGAVRLPGSSATQIEAQIGALLEAESAVLRERRILFTCQRRIGDIERAGHAGVGASPCWLPVLVPCAGMVPASVLLRCVARGAAVGVVPCGDGCPSHQDEAIRGRIDYCRDLLRLLGVPGERVALLSPQDGADSPQPFGGNGVTKALAHGGRGAQSAMFGPGAMVEALRELADERGGWAGLSLEHPHSPVGVVAVEPDRCTGCGACAETCPAGALRLHRDDEAVVLTFDSALCTACGQCVAACPEAEARAIRVDRVTDLARLIRGRETVYRDREARCEACGAVVAPVSMLSRIAAMLGSEDAALAGWIGRYCSSCRSSR